MNGGWSKVRGIPLVVRHETPAARIATAILWRARLVDGMCGAGNETRRHE